MEEWVWFYYEQGFSIIPCRRTDPPTVDNKLPNIPAWKEYITRRPTKTEVEQWLKKGLFKNIGIILGKVSNNAVALDLDDAEIVSDINLDLDKIMDEGNWVQCTGKPGRYHIISRNNKDPGNTIKDNAVHLEHRSNGAYILACPSIHPNGKVYHYLNFEKTKDLPKLKTIDTKKLFVDMVQKLYDKRGIKTHTAKMPVGDREAKCVENALQSGLKEGARNDTCFALASYYSFIKNLQPTEIRLLINNWNKRNKPPLPASELNNAITSALKSGKLTGCNKWKQLNLCPYENPKDCGFLHKTKKTSKKEETPIFEVTMVINNGNLFEQIYDTKNFVPQFVCLDEGELKYLDEVEYNGIKYLPVNDKNAVDCGAIYFPNKPEEYGSLNELLEDIKNFINTYMDVSDIFLTFSTWYILFSWLIDNVHTAPYLRVIADFATGKTRFLHTVGRLCYKPMVIAGATTTASIFRSIERWRGTLILEEYNPENSNFDEDETKILNCGFERGTPVVRCQKDTNKLEYFNCFGAKVISSRQPFKDEALNSRCLTEVLVETNREDIPVQLPEQFFLDQQQLRNKLLMFRLRHWKDVDPAKIQDLKFPTSISRRLRQAFSSFAIIFAHDDNALNSFMKYVEKYNKELIEEMSQSFDGMLINTFFDLKKDGFSYVTSKMISDHLFERGIGSKKDKPYSSSVIAKHLKSMGLPTKVRKIEGKTQKPFVEDVKILENLKRKYVVDVDDLEDEHLGSNLDSFNDQVEDHENNEK